MQDFLSFLSLPKMQLTLLSGTSLLLEIDQNDTKNGLALTNLLIEISH